MAGDWRQAAAYLDEAGRDWELCWYRLGILVHAAVRDDGWLREWRGTYPYDPSVALVVGDALVALAGEARGAKGAKSTSAEQFAAFHQLLVEALPACQEAARLAPDDPCPWIAQITIAYGLQWSHDDFRALWAQITARAPRGRQDRKLGTGCQGQAGARGHRCDRDAHGPRLRGRDGEGSVPEDR